MLTQCSHQIWAVSAAILLAFRLGLAGRVLWRRGRVDELGQPADGVGLHAGDDMA
jgi:hypothetical protein